MKKPELKTPQLKTIVSALLGPLLYTNLVGLALAALWLSFAQQGQVVWIGFSVLVFSPILIPILMIPAGIFSHFMQVYIARQQPEKERLLFLCTVGYILSFLALWCSLIFTSVMRSVSAGALSAGVCWSLTASILPLLWWAARDRNNIFILTMVEVTQLAVFAPAAWYLLQGPLAFWDCFLMTGGILAIAAILQALYEKKPIPQK